MKSNKNYITSKLVQMETRILNQMEIKMKTEMNPIKVNIINHITQMKYDVYNTIMDMGFKITDKVKQEIIKSDRGINKDRGITFDENMKKP